MVYMSGAGEVRVRQGEYQEDAAKVSNSDLFFFTKIDPMNHTTDSPL